MAENLKPTSLTGPNGERLEFIGKGVPRKGDWYMPTWGEYKPVKATGDWGAGVERELLREVPKAVPAQLEHSLEREAELQARFLRNLATPGVSGEAHPSLNEERQVMPSVSELRENSARSLASANTAGSESVTSGPAVLSLRERARAVAEKLAELGFHRDCGNNNRLVIENELETMEEFVELAASLTPAPPATRDYTREQVEQFLQDGVVPIPNSVQGKLRDALGRCLWLLKAPGVSKAKALQGYALAEVINIGEMALKSVNCAAAPAPSTPGPCCPKCGKTTLQFLRDPENFAPYVRCKYGEHENFPVKEVADFAQFFPTLIPPHPIPQPEVEIAQTAERLLVEILKYIPNSMNTAILRRDMLRTIKSELTALPPAPPSQETPK